MPSEKAWISVDGAEKIQNALREVADKAAGILEEATLAGAEIVRAEAARNAPRSTGALAENIEMVVVEKDRKKVNVAIGPDVAKPNRKARRRFYGLFVEFGTQAHTIKARRGRALRIGDEFRAAAEHPGMTPRPFMRPALDSKSEAAQARIADELKSRLGL